MAPPDISTKLNDVLPLALGEGETGSKPMETLERLADREPSRWKQQPLKHCLSYRETISWNQIRTDVNGPAWTDKQIAEAYRCRTKTVENVRQRFVERGFRQTLDGRRPEQPPRGKLLDGKQEAKVIATRLGDPPKGYANWTLRLLASKVVELEIAEQVSPQTVMRTLKKMG